MPKQYKLDKEEKKKYRSLLLLKRMINKPLAVPVVLGENDIYLQPILEELLANNLIEIKKGKYVPTELGREKLEKFMARYSEYLMLYDLPYLAVDLNTGEFACSQYLELEDAAWKVHLSQGRWEDLRVAVADYKDLNPVEIVFMTFMNEGRFDFDSENWQYELVTSEYLDEVMNCCNTNLSWEDLGEEDIIQDIISQGTEILKELIQKQEKMLQESDEGPTDDHNDDEDEDYYVETVEIVTHPFSYYDPYWDDPFYVSPYWNDPWYW